MRLDKTLDVVVIDQWGEPLKEWGQQKFGHNRLSCYVQSETGMSFGIRLVPSAQILSQMDGRHFATKTHRRYGLPDQEPPSSPYDFLATLRLDGRQTAEKCNLIYLDRNNRWFHKHDGKVSICGTNIRESRDSDVKFHKWVFQEVGIESVLEELTLQLDNQAPEPEDPLIEALKGLGSNNLEDKEETAKTGVIEIAIQRVSIEDKITQRQWEPEERTYVSAAGHSKADRNISHTTGRDAGEKAKTNVGSFITYDEIDPDDNPWAVFKFFYRSEDVLRKFDFRGFPTKQLKPDTVSMAKLGLGDGSSKREAIELESDSENDDDSPAQQILSGHKARKSTKTAKQDSPTRGGLAGQAADSELEDFDEEELEELLEVESIARGVAKAVFIEQPLAGPKRAAFSRNEEHATGHIAQTAVANTAKDLIATKVESAKEVVQQKPVESDEEL